MAKGVLRKPFNLCDSGECIKELDQSPNLPRGVGEALLSFGLIIRLGRYNHQKVEVRPVVCIPDIPYAEVRRRRRAARSICSSLVLEIRWRHASWAPVIDRKTNGIGALNSAPFGRNRRGDRRCRRLDNLALRGKRRDPVRYSRRWPQRLSDPPRYLQ
jgi:hypothetical protein